MSKKKSGVCIDCEHCIYIGEGDYICDNEKVTPDGLAEIIMEEHTPNDNYWLCAGTGYKAN